MSTSAKIVRTVPVRHIFGYGVGAVGTNASFGLIMMYLAIFYTDVFLLPPAAMALLFLACRIWDGVNVVAHTLRD